MIGREKDTELFRGLHETGRLGHGYIFYGPAMVGKKSFALELAHYLETGDFAPVRGEEMLQDATVIAGGAGEGGIDAVRTIKNFLWQKPVRSSRRTLIIDDGDMLTNEAQNALLKVTEEPPVSSLLILITSDSDGVLPTIISRLPQIYMGTTPRVDIAKWLEAEYGFKKADASAYASRALGKPGLAIRLATDVPFREKLASAEKFLKTPVAARRDFIKELIEPDDFSLKKFLDAVIMTLAWQDPAKTKATLWHRALELSATASNFGLNPRLQLEALLS